MSDSPPTESAPPPSAGAQPPLWTREFALFLLAQSAFGYAFSGFFLLPKFLSVELGAGPEAVGLVTGLFGAANVLGTPFAGAWADRFGPRVVVLAAAAVMAVSSLGFLAVDRLGVLVVLLRLVQGVAVAVGLVAGSVLAVERAPAARVGEAVGLFGASMLVMNAVAPAVIEPLAEVAGWGWGFATCALAALFCGLLVTRLPEPSRAAADPTAAGLLELLARAPFPQLFGAMLLSALAFSALMAFHQPWALELGFERVRPFLVAYSAVALAVRIGLGRVVDRAGPLRVAVASLLPYTLACVATAGLEGLPLWLPGALFGLGHGLFYPALSAVAVAATAAQERGRAMALITAAFGLGQALGPIGLGVLAERAGYPSVFLVAAGLAAGGALPLLAARQHRPT